MFEEASVVTFIRVKFSWRCFHLRRPQEDFSVPFVCLWSVPFIFVPGDGVLCGAALFSAGEDGILVS